MKPRRFFWSWGDGKSAPDETMTAEKAARMFREWRTQRDDRGRRSFAVKRLSRHTYRVISLKYGLASVISWEAA